MYFDASFNMHTAHTAHRLINHMEENANPCENFYTFACGGLDERFGKDYTYSFIDEVGHRLNRLISGKIYFTFIIYMRF